MKKDSHRHENAKRIMKLGGYKKGGAVKEPSGPSTDVVEKPYKKLKTGGYVQGNTPKKRLDKPSRKSQKDDMKIPHLARGGKTGKGKTVVNVIVTGKDGGGAPGAMPMAPRPMPAMPPGAGAPMPPGAGMPPGMPPHPPQMAKRGGKIKENPAYPIKDGSGGGEGRLQKAAAAKKTHKGEKRGKD